MASNELFLCLLSANKIIKFEKIRIINATDSFKKVLSNLTDEYDHADVQVFVSLSADSSLSRLVN